MGSKPGLTVGTLLPGQGLAKGYYIQAREFKKREENNALSTEQVLCKTFQWTQEILGNVKRT